MSLAQIAQYQQDEDRRKYWSQQMADISVKHPNTTIARFADRQWVKINTPNQKLDYTLLSSLDNLMQTNQIIFAEAIVNAIMRDAEEVQRMDIAAGCEELTLIKQFPSGHKYFKDLLGRIHIADDSGETPLETEDGDLIVDFGRLISASTPASNHFVLPLLTPDKRETSTIVGFRELEFLQAQGMALNWSAKRLAAWYKGHDADS